MRIAHYLIGSEIAGGELVASELAQSAVAAGHRVIAIVPRDGPIVGLLERGGVTVHILAAPTARDPRQIWRLWRLLRRERIDLLHTHALFTGNLVARVAGRLAGRRIVAHAHIADRYAAGKLTRAAQRRLDAASARLCSRVVAVSEDLGQTLLTIGYPARNLVVIPNGVRFDRPSPRSRERIRLELGIAPEAPLVGAVGRLCVVKGQRELIEAAAQVGRRHAGLRIVLVGRDLEQGGEFEAELRGLATTHGIADDVVFAGYRDDVPAVLEALDVFVLPSHAEGLPLVLLEAMARARPIVATTVGGVPEAITDGVDGLLVEPGEPDQLAAAIDSLLADPARARELGQRAFATFDRSYRAERMGERVLALYDEIIGGKAG